MLNRRTAIRSFVAAALGLVWKKKEELVVETPDAKPRDAHRHICGYLNESNEKTDIILPKGHWKLSRIIFRKVGG